ncbi:MAG: hypothetical protein ACD_47C00435G0001, partial [uncultured bacterium]
MEILKTKLMQLCVFMIFFPLLVTAAALHFAGALNTTIVMASLGGGIIALAGAL